MPLSRPPVVAGRFVGQSVLRKEDPRLVTGHGSYVDDMTLAPAVSRRVRSQRHRPGTHHPSGGDPRRPAAEGVIAVLTAADLNPTAGNMVPTMFLDGSFGMSAPLRPLADGDVRFVGDPIAIVLAESRYLAEDACELDRGRHRGRRGRRRLRAGRRRHRASGASRARQQRGRIARDAQSRRSTPSSPARPMWPPRRFINPASPRRPMETRGVLVSVDAYAGSVTMWLSSQMPHEARAGPLPGPGCPRASGPGDPKGRRGRLRPEGLSCTGRRSSPPWPPGPSAAGEMDRGPAGKPHRRGPCPARPDDGVVCRWTMRATSWAPGLTISRTPAPIPAAAPAAAAAWSAPCSPAPITSVPTRGARRRCGPTPAAGAPTGARGWPRRWPGSR